MVMLSRYLSGIKRTLNGFGKPIIQIRSTAASVSSLPRREKNGRLALHVLGAVTVSGATLYWIYQNKVYPTVTEAAENKKKLVILGSGWGAVSVIKSLKPGLYDVKVVSPTNYFLFTPLLPSVTVGTVDGRSLLEPIRNVLSKNNYEYFEAECINVNTEKNQIVCLDKSGKKICSKYFSKKSNFG